jgi:gliding motility-associated-like protein
MLGNANNITVNAPIQLLISVTDGCGSPSANVTASVAMVTEPVLSVSLPAQKGCEPFVAVFDIPGGAQPGISYEWNFGDGQTSGATTTTHQYTQAGVYQVTLAAWPVSFTACSTSVNVNGPVTVLPLPIARFEFSPLVPTVNRPEVRFDDRSSFADFWKWNFGDNSPEELIPDPIHIYRGAGVYPVKLQVQSSDGCSDSIVRTVEVVEEMQFFIPNAFTADENGINDRFDITGVGYDSYEISIYDRWGKLVHQSKNGSSAWDGKDKETGKPLPQGLYICKVTMNDKLGNSITKYSQVTLLR